MGILKNSIKAIYRAFPIRTLITNTSQVYVFEKNAGRKFVSSRNEIIEWRNFSDRIEIIKENGNVTMHKTFLDHDRSRPPKINVYRYSDSNDINSKHTFITIMPTEITIGNNLDDKIELFTVIKDSWA